ncbi:aminopeptidase N [Alcaligenaceae bacterium]|nr:aminopeptidase N [Alcaligenaceae bacterium]
MRTETSPTISRQDYRPFPYRLPAVSLCLELDDALTRVTSTMEFERLASESVPLVLNGQNLGLESVSIDGRRLAESEYRLRDETLLLEPAGERFTVEIVSTCRPESNSTLMGLYVSGDHLFTQCEAEGFRRITWFPDRPDVMSRYRVTLRADKARYPLLLSNGNLLSERDLGGGRHEAVWEDPHPKPSYLFAVVAGDFACREQRIATRSGRDALLQVYSDHGAEDRTEWALDSLIRSVRWDERRYGLELDLDRFMIVAARDFNMGAMENKGLNVFNSAYVLADPSTATDTSYRAIEAVIGHEYFHNWTGNRVTCRDWFQLSLKEGLTVFRDQEFSADMLASGLDGPAAASARAVKRIDDVSTLRIAQFPEDAGPMAHPIRPESYQEIANFYTATIYEKGAEVIRMQQTLLGREGFREGLEEYFRRHDGQAVTCDDFIAAMESVYKARNPGRDLRVFRHWYGQAGTPRVSVRLEYDAAARSCTLTLSQSNPPAGIELLQDPPAAKPPLHIPVAVGLLTPDGEPIIPEGAAQHPAAAPGTLLLELLDASQSWTFHGVAQRPVLSLLRDFSAPVVIDHERPDAELALLARLDPDPFARWEAGQELARGLLLARTRAVLDGAPPPSSDVLCGVWTALLEDDSLSPAYLARVLSLPSQKELIERTRPMEPQAVVQAYRGLASELGRRLAALWVLRHEATADPATPYSPDAESMGRRALHALSLGYLLAGEHPGATETAMREYESARNMTDCMAALSALANWGGGDARNAVYRHFYDTWQHDPLVVDRWFAVQAASPFTTVEEIQALMLHPAFSLRNPNRARSVVFQFCMNNPRNAHSEAGYGFWADQVLALDALNPEVAARLARAFDNWSRFTPSLREPARAALERIRQHPVLSRNVAEIVNKALSIHQEH